MDIHCTFASSRSDTPAIFQVLSNQIRDKSSCDLLSREIMLYTPINFQSEISHTQIL